MQTTTNQFSTALLFKRRFIKSYPFIASYINQANINAKKWLFEAAAMYNFKWLCLLRKNEDCVLNTE